MRHYKKLGNHSHYIDKSGSEVYLKYTGSKDKCDMEVVQLNKKENKSSRAILRIVGSEFILIGLKNNKQISGLRISPSVANQFLEKVQSRILENKQYLRAEQEAQTKATMELAQITDGNEADDLLSKIEGGEYDMA